MNIVILDGYTCNPGDLSWQAFERLGHVTVYESTTPEQIVERCRGADCIINNKVLLPETILKQLPWIQYIGLLSTGYNVVDVKAAAKLHIPVTFVPSYGTAAVAQHTFALLLELCNHVGSHACAVKEGEWSSCGRFCFWNAPLTELAGKTIGIIGMGRIGSAVAVIAKALGMQIVYASRSEKADLPYRRVSLEELLTCSDVVSLHCPLTDETKNLINKTTLSYMKPSAFLINTARGNVLDEAAVADALNQNQLAGAAVDVLREEPPVHGSPLLTAKNCVITPHLAWAAKETRQRLIELAADNLEKFLAGHPVNIAK